VNPTLKTQVIFAVILDSMPVQERFLKTKEIPSPERNTLKETPYLDSIGNLSSVHVQCHTIDLVVFKIERIFRNSSI
jgi:hypothetical protein